MGLGCRGLGGGGGVSRKNEHPPQLVTLASWHLNSHDNTRNRHACWQNEGQEIDNFVGHGAHLRSQCKIDRNFPFGLENRAIVYPPRLLNDITDTMFLWSAPPAANSSGKISCWPLKPGK